MRVRAKRKPSNAMAAIVGCAEAERAGVVGSVESPRGTYPEQVLTNSDLGTIPT